MPLVEKKMTESELREAIARLDRLIAANPPMARDFTAKKVALTNELHTLLLSSGEYEVIKSSVLAERVKAAFAAGIVHERVQHGLRPPGTPEQVKEQTTVEADQPVQWGWPFRKAKE